MNTQVKPKATILDLDAILDKKMNDIETLPDYVNPPAGLYILSIPKCEIEKYDAKDDDGKKTVKAQRIRLTYKVEQTIQHDQNEQPVPDGAMFSTTFTGTDQGLEFFKKAAMVVLGIDDFEEASIKDVMQGVLEAEPFCAKITVAVTKGDGGKTYENIRVSRGVLPESAAS